MFHKIRSHHIICLSAGLMFPLAVFGPLGYAILFPVTAWIAFGLRYFQDRTFAPFSKRSLWLLISLHVWGSLSTLWSIYYERTLILSGSLLFLSLSGVVLWKVCQTFTSSQRDLILKWMTIGLGIGGLFLGFESLFEGALLKTLKSESHIYMYKFNKATSIFSIFIWPVVFTNYFKGRRILSLLLLILIVSGIFSLESDTSKYSLILGVIAFGIAYRFRRSTALAAWGLFSFILIMPLLSQTIFKPENFKEISPVLCKNSLVHRLYVWEYVGSQIREKPLYGWGLDTARSKQFSDAKINCQFNNFNKGGYHFSAMPALLLHPHNAGLQWWLELGFIGVVLASLFIIQIPWNLRQWLHKERRAAAFATFTTATSIALISYGIWQNWWIATLWLAVIYSEMLLAENCTSNQDKNERVS